VEKKGLVEKEKEQFSCGSSKVLKQQERRMERNVGTKDTS